MGENNNKETDCNLFFGYQFLQLHFIFFFFECNCKFFILSSKDAIAGCRSVQKSFFYIITYFFNFVKHILWESRSRLESQINP